MEEWYCEIAGREIGPLSSHQLKAMAVEGKIQPTDHVRRGPTGPWASASRVRGLFPAAQGSPSKPPAAQPTAPQQSAQQPTAPQPAPASPPSFFAAGENITPSSVETPGPVAPQVSAPPSFFATPNVPEESVPAPPTPLPPSPPGALPPPPPSTEGIAETAENEESFVSEDEPDDEAMPEDVFKEPPGTELSPQARNLSLLVHARRKRQQQMMMAGALLFVLLGVVIAAILLATSDVKKIAEVKQPRGLTGLSKKLSSAAAEKKAEDSDKADTAAKKEQAAKSEPIASAKPEEPKPDKEDPAAATALRMVVGDVPVRIVSLVRDTSDTNGSRLVITVEVKNPDAKEKMAFSPWNRDGGVSGVTLTDDQGKTYSSKPIDAASILGKPTPFSIEPTKTAEDVLAFEAPGGNVEFLQLDLPGGAFGKEATAGFKIPTKLIVAQQIVAKAPPGAFAPKKKAAKSRPKPKPGTPEADFGLDDFESPMDESSPAKHFAPETPPTTEKPASKPESDEPKKEKPTVKPISMESSTESAPGESDKAEAAKSDSSPTEASSAKQPTAEDSDPAKAETEELKKEMDKEWTPLN